MSSLMLACGYLSTKPIYFYSSLCIFLVASIKRTPSILTTGEYVSQYLSPHCCIPPWEKIRALCLSNSLSGFIFLLKDHIALTGLALLGRVSRWTTEQEPPASWSDISFSVASTNYILSSCFIAFINVKHSLVAMLVAYMKWCISLRLMFYRYFTSWKNFLTFSV